MPGITSQEKLLIFAAVLTMLVIGGAFLAVILLVNRRLNNEQKDVETIESQGGFEPRDLE